MLRRSDMRPYQTRGSAFVKSQLKKGLGAALLIDMGLGKTIISLTALADLLADGTITRVLLVGPLRVVMGVWRQEARKWAHTRHITFKLVHGNETKRLQALESDAQVHLINVDNVPWLFQVLKTRRKREGGWPYDALFIDESSMFKTPGSKRFTSLRSYLKNFQHRVIMTGTFAPKGLMDVWSQVFILDRGARLGETVSSYRSRFFSPSGYMGYGYTPDEGAAEKVLSLISPIALTMRAEDWLDLPEVLEQTIYVDLPPTAARQYAQLEKDMYLELEKGNAEALSAASLSSKCWQLANGALIVEAPDGQKVWQPMHDAKIDALREVLDGTSENVLVAYWFKSDLARLREAYPKAPCIADAKNPKALERLQDEWNAGKHRVMFIHPQGGGHGLNLQGGGNEMVFFSMLWGREAYAQVRERMGAARQVGKRDCVRYKYIVCRGTVDEVMIATQRQRHHNERAYVRMLKEYREVRELLT